MAPEVIPDENDTLDTDAELGMLPITDKEILIALMLMAA